MRAGLATFAMGVCLLAGSAASAAGGPSVSIVDNAFLRGVERPVLHVRVGTTVTWRWHSQESHSVMVHSGPEHFASSIRNRGTYVHRFMHAGSYRVVCALHAPGMKMTVVVRR